ncbi:hypothetical protein [Alishewanella sp. HL-SH06]|uniref:hypothetical protein n=1 Tax=Alishewanella sp. HL-SH06 TaxID=3461144 RepID=UPI0040424116
MEAKEAKLIPMLKNKTINHTREQWVDQYRYLTQFIMPKEALDKRHDWPIKHDHCFQRVVLDNVCNGAWYDYIKQPAYRHLGAAQAQAAVKLCEDILAGEVDLHCLNKRSLRWRQKQSSFAF